MTPRKSMCFGREAEELPEPILQHILSFLDFTDVIRASAVSKAWNTAVSTLHCLNLTDDFILPLDNHDSENPSASSAMETPKLRRLISAAMFISEANTRNLHVQKFNFKFLGIYSFAELLVIGMIIDLTVSKNMGEFEFEVRSDVGWDYYLFPRCFYVTPSLHKLVLGGLKLSLSNVDGIFLPSLRELDLRNNHIDTDFLEQLILNCPQLVILNLHDCFGFHALRVLGSHPKLERIDLIKDFKRDAPQEVRKIEIKEASYLKYFCFRSNGEHSLHILDLAACKNLKVLELTGFHGNNKLIKSVEQLISSLKVLESFTLRKFIWRGYGFKSSFIISSNSLRELWLGSFCSGVHIQVHAPQLSKFVHCGYISSILSFDASSRKVANFVKFRSHTMKYNKLVEFLRSFNHFEEVRLDDFEPRHLRALKYLEENLDPPLWDVKCLTLGVRYSLDNRYIPVDMEMLEGLLWMAPQLDTLSFDNLKSILTLQFIHDNSVHVEEGSFISGNKIWIKVKVESCPGDAQGWELKKYYFDVERSMAGFLPLKVIQIMSKKCL